MKKDAQYALEYLHGVPYLLPFGQNIARLVLGPLALELRGAAEYFSPQLTAYAGAPQRAAMDGETVLTVQYVIPAQAVKTEMKSLLRAALEDQRLSTRIRNFYLTGLQEGYFEYLSNN